MEQVPPERACLLVESAGRAEPWGGETGGPLVAFALFVDVVGISGCLAPLVSSTLVALASAAIGGDWLLRS